MWQRLIRMWPRNWVWRRAGLAGCAAGLVTLAFCWGRWGALSEATATPPSPSGEQTPVLPASMSDYGRRPVAYIYNSIPITREDLGEYLIARFGAERVEFLVNRRIIERACQAKGIQVTDQEVEVQLVEDLKSMNIARLEDFVNHVLKRFNKTLYEYKEDVIRPKLALSKYCRGNITISEEDLQKAFEARFGPKVKCRMIVLSKEQAPHKLHIHEEVSKSESEFRKYAREQAIPALAAKGGEAPPIHRHFGDVRVEQEAFSLKVGGVSAVIDMPDGTSVILKCDELLAPDTTRQMEQERLGLHRDIVEARLAQEIPRVFQELRRQADPKIFLQKDISPAELERRTNELLQPTIGNGPRPSQVPNGN